MGADNTMGSRSGSRTAASGGNGEGNTVDATQPLRTTQGSSSGTGPDGGVIGQAQEGASNIVGQVQETAGDVVDQVRQQATSRLAEGKDRASGTLGQVAEAIRETGTTLRDKDQPEIANYANTAASQLDRLSSYLQNRDVDDLIIEVQRFARRQPGLFLGGAFALGLLGARFLKSSGRSGQGAQASQWDATNTSSGYRSGYGSGYGSHNYGRSGSGYTGPGGSVRSSTTGSMDISSMSGTSGAASSGAAGARAGAADEWVGGSSTGYAAGLDDTAGDVNASDDLTSGGTSGFTPYTPGSEA